MLCHPVSSHDLNQVWFKSDILDAEHLKLLLKLHGLEYVGLFDIGYL